MALGLTPQQIVDKGTHPLLGIKKDWRRIQLQEIAEVQNGYAFKSTFFTQDEGVPLIRIRDINSKDTDHFYNGDYDDSYIVRKNDVLIGMDGDFNVTKWPGEMGLLNQRVCRIKCDTAVYDEDFLFYVLQPYLNAVHAETSAVTVKHLSSKTIKALPIPLPPLPEQRAIVAKLERLFAELDRSVAELEAAREKLGVYRQSVLKEAFGGRLSEGWRSNHIDVSSTVDSEITTAREECYKFQLEEYNRALSIWKQTGGAGKKPKKPRKLDVPDAPTETHEHIKWSIPDRWCWTQLGIIGFVTKLAGFEYTKFVSYSENGDLLVLKAENAATNGFKPTDFSKVDSETVKDLTRTILHGGEMLVVFVGAGTGNVAIVPKDQTYFLGPNIGMVRPYLDLNEKYLLYFYQFAGGKDLMLATMKAVAQPSLSMGTIRQAPLALTCKSEQDQIVQEIETRLSVADKLEQEITDSLERARRLRQGVLKRAFAGKLIL